MKTSVIVVAAGMGRRMKSETSKQLIQIGDKPILWHTLNAFESMGIIDEVVLVVKEDEQSFIEEEILIDMKKVLHMVVGGKERSDSVKNGLEAVKDAEIVMIHDGARPFVTEEAVLRLFEVVKKDGAAILGVPVKDTIKAVDDNNKVEKTYERNKLWAIQTPQAFKRDIIEEAFEGADRVKSLIYDDAMLVEAVLGKEVKVVQGADQNIKITTPFDLVIGDAIYNSKIRGE